ncbi:MAG: hypothetical protein R8M38_03445 [Mariprofundaceae bacterium]
MVSRKRHIECDEEKASMQVLADGLSQKRHIKKYDKVLRKIGRLQEKYARAAQHYTIEVDRMTKVSMPLACVLHAATTIQLNMPVFIV